MTDQQMYHEGMRSLQDMRDTRPLADRLEQVAVRTWRGIGAMGRSSASGRTGPSTELRTGYSRDKRFKWTADRGFRHFCRAWHTIRNRDDFSKGKRGRRCVLPEVAVFTGGVAAQHGYVW